METYSHKVIGSKKETVYYKLNLNDSGTLLFRCEDSAYTTVEFYGSNANKIDVKYGNSLSGLNGREIKIEKSGTYYLCIKLDMANYSYFTNLYYTFKSNKTPTISLALTVKVGDELDFSALASNYTGKVTWKTTKSAVATVKSGKVTAKSAGKAKIRAYMDNGDYAEITVVVKKK